MVLQDSSFCCFGKFTMKTSWKTRNCYQLEKRFSNQNERNKNK